MKPVRLTDVTDAIPVGNASDAEYASKVGASLKQIGGVVAAASPFDMEGQEYPPVIGAVLVLFTREGEPVPIVFGACAELLRDRRRWNGMVGEAYRAVGNLWPMFQPAGWDADASWWENVYTYVRAEWERVETFTTRHEAERAADKAELERTHPFLCDCGRRCKSSAGLKRHQQSRRCWRDSK